MALKHWSDDLCVGITQIDEQHRRIFDLTNRWHEALLANQPREQLTAYFVELLAYTKVHFTTEETLYQQYGYPGALPHKQEHQRLTNVLYNFRKKLEAEAGDETQEEIIVFLNQWLERHLEDADRKAALFLKSQSVA
jgi:hemerythrin